MPQYKDILYKISPWFVKIDSSGRCSVILIYEQKAELGYPVKKEIQNGNPMYHYKKKIDTWIYGVEGNDSLMVYNNGTTPGAGIIFKRYKPN